MRALRVDACLRRGALGDLRSYEVWRDASDLRDCSPFNTAQSAPATTIA